MLVSPVQQCASAMCARSRPPLHDPWTVAHQAPLSVGFSRQACWSGLPFPAPGDFSDPGIKPASSTSPSVAGGFSTAEPSGKPKSANCIHLPPWTCVAYPRSRPARLAPCCLPLAERGCQCWSPEHPAHTFPSVSARLPTSGSPFLPRKYGHRDHVSRFHI